MHDFETSLLKSTQLARRVTDNSFIFVPEHHILGPNRASADGFQGSPHSPSPGPIGSDRNIDITRTGYGTAGP
jgi:hypothetical protein